MSSDELESVTGRCHWEMSGAIMSLQAITGERKMIMENIVKVTNNLSLD